MKLKKLFFSMLSVGFLGLTSFSSAGTVEDNITLLGSGRQDVSYSSYQRIWDYSKYEAGTYCINFTSNTPAQLYMGFATPQASGPTNTYLLYANQFGNWVCLYANKSSLYAKLYASGDPIEVNYRVFKLNHLLSSSCGGSSDCSSVESALSGCQSSLDSLSGSLSTCQSDLSSCLNGVDVSYQACIENLSGCQSDLTNMTNYNESLSSQLNECLAELPVPCEGTGCEDTIITDQRFSFFRENNGERFSLPVANNVFLPQGFRAYVDSGVVAITRIQEKSDPVLADGSFSEVNSLFFHFFKSVIIVLFFALFLRFIKTLIYPLFIPKNKE